MSPGCWHRCKHKISRLYNDDGDELAMFEQSSELAVHVPQRAEIEAWLSALTA
jgi:hypothetical protein